MLTGYTDGVSELGSSKELDDDDDDEEEELNSEQILHTSSFDELKKHTLKYDTVIWVSISFLLVLAWGIAILVLPYLPIRRHVLQKEISL